MRPIIIIIIMIIMIMIIMIIIIIIICYCAFTPLLVSCSECLAKEFMTKKNFFCRVCKSMVKRGTLSEKSLVELEVERDSRIRKRIKEMYLSKFASVVIFYSFEFKIQQNNRRFCIS